MGRREDIAEIYIATFNRAPDSDGLNYWESSPLTINSIAESFFYQVETQIKYPESLNDSEFVNTIYNNLFNRAAEPAGLIYWVNELESGNINRPDMILAIVNGAIGVDAEILSNKTEVGLYFADNGETLTYEESLAIMIGVDETQASVDNAKQQIDEWVDGSGDAPAAPTIGTVAGDNIVDESEATAGFKISGTGEAGDTVTVKFESGVTLSGGNTATVAADGTWSLNVTSTDVTAMGEGPEGIVATQTNADGLTSLPAFRAISVDTTPVNPPTPAPEELKFTDGPDIVYTWNGAAYDLGISLEVNKVAAVTTVGFDFDREKTFYANDPDTITVKVQPSLTDGIVTAKDAAVDKTIISDTIVWIGSGASNTLDTDLGTRELDELIFGFNNNDVLKGFAGDDQIFGGLGADKLYGGEGNDRLIIRTGDQVVDGGTGNDVAEFDTNIDMTGAGKIWTGIETANAVKDGVSLTLTADQVVGLTAFNGDGTGVDELLTINTTTTAEDIDISGIVLNGSSITLQGDTAVNNLTGGDGDDKIIAGTGDDIVNGGAGNDIVKGQGGKDTIHGDEGNDDIDGGAGADTIFGDAGNDTIYGGADNDIIYGGADNDTIDGGNGDDTIRGDAGNDTIKGWSGNDTLIGGAGADVLTGDGGNDTYQFDAGDSVLGSMDEITFFGAGSDKITFGGSIGTAGNVAKADGTGTLDLMEFLDHANAVMDGTKIYYGEYNINGTGSGYLAFDRDGDGDYDDVVEISNFATNADLFIADII